MDKNDDWNVGIFMNFTVLIAFGIGLSISGMEFKVRVVLFILIMACIVISGILFRIIQKRREKTRYSTMLVECLEKLLDVLIELSRKNHGMTVTRNEEEVSITVLQDEPRGQLMVFRGLGRHLPDIFAMDSSHAYEGEIKDGKLHLETLETFDNELKEHLILKVYDVNTIATIIEDRVGVLTMDDDEGTLTLTINTIDLLAATGVGKGTINDLKTLINEKDAKIEKDMKIHFIIEHGSSLIIKMLDPFRPESGPLTIRFHDAPDLVVVYHGTTRKPRLSGRG